MSFPWNRRQPDADGPTVLPHQLAQRTDPDVSEQAPGLRRLLTELTPTSDDRWLVGDALRRHRESHGLTDAQLADGLGITPERLRWLQMRTRPNPHSPTFHADVQRLAATFGCNADALLDVLAA